MESVLSTSEETPSSPSDKHGWRNIPLIAKVYGIVCILASVVVVPFLVFIIVNFTLLVIQGELDQDYSVITIILFAAEAVLLLGLAIMLLVLGIRLLRNRRRGAAQTAEACAFTTVGILVCDIMLLGFSSIEILFLAEFIVSVILASWLDPSLAQERKLQRRLRDMETREAAEEGTLGLDETGHGYITLNFFNLFWIFTVASVIGLVLETIFHVLIVDPGRFQDRAGLLFGPFSPIYGVGAVLMTMALNRFHKAPLLVIFLVSALIGGAFEYLASWFFQSAFGIVAWDYTGTFLSIDGRTNGKFMTMWGLLGVAWIKLILPWMLKLVNLIPWNWRYTLTTICATLMVIDCSMTLLSFECWYERLSGSEPETAVEVFMAQYFDNDYMQERFQSMSLDPSEATRSQSSSA